MLSLVIPLVNEAPSLAELHREIAAVLDRERLDAEIIFVDDGSSDLSWATIRDLAERRSARARHSPAPQFRQGRRSLRRFSERLAATW